MNTYFSTFTPGLGEVVSDILTQTLPQTEVKLVLDGLIVYETSASIKEITDLPFFNNSFYVFHFFKKIEPDSLPGMIKFVYQSNFLEKIAVPRIEGRDRTFRVISSKENKLGVIDQNLQKNIENKIAKETRLTLDRGKPQLEFWFLERLEGVGFFGLRLTYKHSAENLNPGELRPELASLLCSLSEPEKEDVFLDPFCGWGAIPLARKKLPYSKIFCSDVDQEKVDRLKGMDLEATTASAEDSSYLENSSVNKIVTDPPWGLAEDIEVEPLYKKMMGEFARVLKPGGLLIVLTSRKLIFEELLANYPQFKLEKKFDILVNGKKAGVYKLKRQA